MPQPRRSYTDTEVDTSLLVLCMTGRNSVVAARRLKEEGIDVDPRTLRSWRERIHADRYLAIEHEHAPTMERQMLGQARAIITRANDVTLLAIEETEKQLRAGELKDASTAARNLSTSAGIMTDKTLLLEGRPTEIRGNEDLDAALSRMAQRLNLPQTVDSTAEEYEPSTPELES